MANFIVTTIVKKIVRRAGLMPILTCLDNFRCHLLKQYAIARQKNPLEYVYNDKFFSIERHEFVLGQTPRILAESVQEFCNPKSVIDFGCGCGIYLREMEKLGIEVFGIDGSPASARNLAIDQGKFLLQDLTQNFSLPRRFDCAICFEVAEHIPTPTSATLVSNIIAASETVIFTAAHEGQGGHDHINEQPPAFWIDLFARKGYTFLENDTAYLRQKLGERGAIFWLVENIMVFRKHTD